MLSDTNKVALQSAATGVGNGTVIRTDGFNTLVFDVQGTFVGTTQFETSTDQAKWFGLNVTNLTTGAAGTTATATGLYQAAVSGVTYARARVSDYTSGTLNIMGKVSVGGGAGGGGGNVTAGTINLATVVGNIAAGSADSGNPVKVGGKYNGTAPTLDSGDRGDLELDVSGNLKATQATLLAGEDLTNNVLGVLAKPVSSSTYSPSLFANLGGSLTSLVKGSAGNVYGFDCTNLSASVAYFQFINVATVGPLGSVPVYSFMLPPGTTTTIRDNTFFSPSHHFTTGISVGIGTAGGTLGTTGLTAANFIYHVHYV